MKLPTSTGDRRIFSINSMKYFMTNLIRLTEPISSNKFQVTKFEKNWKGTTNTCDLVLFFPAGPGFLFVTMDPTIAKHKKLNNM